MAREGAPGGQQGRPQVAYYRTPHHRPRPGCRLAQRRHRNCHKDPRMRLRSAHPARQPAPAARRRSPPPTMLPAGVAEHRRAARGAKCLVNGLYTGKGKELSVINISYLHNNPALSLLYLPHAILRSQHNSTEASAPVVPAGEARRMQLALDTDLAFADTACCTRHQASEAPAPRSASWSSPAQPLCARPRWQLPSSGTAPLPRRTCPRSLPRHPRRTYSLPQAAPAAPQRATGPPLPRPARRARPQAPT